MVKGLFRAQTFRGKAVVSRFSYTIRGSGSKMRSGVGELIRDWSVSNIRILSDVSLL